MTVFKLSQPMVMITTHMMIRSTSMGTEMPPSFFSTPPPLRKMSSIRAVKRTIPM